MRKEEKRFGIVNYFKVEIKDGVLNAKLTHCPRCEDGFVMNKEYEKCVWMDCHWRMDGQEVIGSIMLIGSMQFGKLFLELEKQLTFRGYNVILPYIDGLLSKINELQLPSKSNYNEKQWEYLELYMLKRIDMVEGVFVVNDKMEIGDQEGYIGAHTKEELLYTVLTKSSLNEKDWWKYIGSIYKIDYDKIFTKDYAREKIKKWNDLWGMDFHTEEILSNPIFK